MPSQYTIVLPIKVTNNHNDLERFTQIQLRSLNKFLDISSIYEFLIVCKENEIDHIQQTLIKNPSPLPIRLITESILIKQGVIDEISGWRLQQLIKLGISSIVKTPLYLVLDSDCFLTKHFSYENLFYQEKILIDRESWIAHPDWWIASAEIINDTPLTRLANRPVIAVTPQILVTELVCELIDHLSHKKKGLNWDEYLSTQIFTEFTLYWLFLLKKNITDIYQLSGTGPSLLGNALWVVNWQKRNWWTQIGFLKKSMKKQWWTQIGFLKKSMKKQGKKNEIKTQILHQQVKTSFESNDNFYFSLIQSNIEGIPLNSIINELNKYLT